MNVRVNTTMIESANGGDYEDIMIKRELERYVAQVRTMYKQKGKKICRANVPLPHGVNLGGGVNWESIGSQEGRIVARRSCLTPEQLTTMQIGGEFLTDLEKQIFVDILFMFEGAIAFDDSEIGLLNLAIEPSAVSYTVPHIPWQQQSIRLPKAMQEIATQYVKEKITNGMVEFSQDPYRSRYFLVKKKKAVDFGFINNVQLLNSFTIRDSDMPPSVDEFSEFFAGYPITSAIHYCSGYNEIPLAKESRNVTAFPIELSLVPNMQLPQEWINLVVYF